VTRGRLAKVLAVRHHADGTRRVPDRVIAEEPLEIQLDGVTVTTTLRTPGADFELAAGFSVSEGLLEGTTITGIRYCAAGSAVQSEFNVVTVETARSDPAAVSSRLTATTSACGLCGSEAIGRLTDRLRPVGPPPPLDPRVVAAVAEHARGAQPLFDATGSVHAAAAFDLAGGEVLHVREDIGRHNAVDKVVGRLVLDGALPASGLGLFVSGRAGFEMVQKAWAAGFRWLAAVGGPSSLAVATARAADLGLMAFVRGSSMTCYWPDGER
jgi:FdhD protein